MAYASNFNPDALPAHAEPEEAARILARRTEVTASPSPNPPVPAIAQPPRSSASPGQTDYNSKPPPPLPVNTSGAPHRNTLAGSARPPASLYSPINSPQPPSGPSTPLTLQAGFPGRGGQSQPPRRVSTPSRSGDASLWPLFKAVDRRGTGQLSETELSQALMNGDYTTFDPATVRMMIRMHDHDQSGTIGFEEFCALWSFLGSWRVLFDQFDEDKSGYINYPEYTNALIKFGYNLTSQFVDMLYRTYDRGNPNGLSFDLFVQSCLTLKRLTDVFKKYDTDRDGYITLSFEDFLTEVLQSR